MSDPLADDPYRHTCAEVTCAMYEAHQAGRRTLSLRELLAIFDEPPRRTIGDAMIWLEMEWHDDWSWLGEPGERPR